MLMLRSQAFYPTKLQRIGEGVIFSGARGRRDVAVGMNAGSAWPARHAETQGDTLVQRGGRDHHER